MAKPVMRKKIDGSTSHTDPDFEVPPGAWWEGSMSRQGSHDVFVNGKPIMRITDTYKPHVGYKHIEQFWPDGTSYAKQVPDQHAPPEANEGSSTVFVNGLGVHLTGHDVKCPQEKPGLSSKATGGSPDVFAGE